jgi:toxin ParE1/3/4
VTIRYYTKALEEFLNCIDYYNEISPELASYFDQDLITALDQIKKQPLSAPEHKDHKELHVKKCRKFPFSIIYHIEFDLQTIFIVAIAHHKRRPDYWVKRI